MGLSREGQRTNLSLLVALSLVLSFAGLCDANQVKDDPAHNCAPSDRNGKSSSIDERSSGDEPLLGSGLDNVASTTLALCTASNPQRDVRDLKLTDVVTNISTQAAVSQPAYSCYLAYSSWRQSSTDWYEHEIAEKSWSTYSVNTTIIQTLPAVSTIYPTGSLSTYKLCDGSARVDLDPLTLTSNVTSTTVFPKVLTVGTPTFASSRPCTASSEDCQYLYYNSGLSWEDITLNALCGSPAHLGLPCLIAGGPVQLAYFPVTTAGSDKCQSNGITITNTNGPTTIEALGTTLTSGTVYISFQSLFAYQEGFGNRIGPSFDNFILPLPSSAISTQCGGWFSARGQGTPLNYADLNFPWPASAYNCMNRCSTDLSYTQINGTAQRYTPPPQCSTIWSDLNPILAMPTEVRNLVPAWSTCSMFDEALPNFIFDPPLALRPGTAVAIPTPNFPGQFQTPSASPASTTYMTPPQTAVVSSSITPDPASSVSTQSHQKTTSGSARLSPPSCRPLLLVVIVAVFTCVL